MADSNGKTVIKVTDLQRKKGETRIQNLYFSFRTCLSLLFSAEIQILKLRRINVQLLGAHTSLIAAQRQEGPIQGHPT